MAIDPSTEYPGQIDTSDPSGYPYGKPRDDITDDDGTGTPLQDRWLSDVFGLQQALLEESGIVPSGTPDKVGASQYLEALHGALNKPATYKFTTGPVSLSTPLVMSEIFNPLSRYSLVGGSSDGIICPEAGIYLATYDIQISSTNTGAPLQFSVFSYSGASLVHTMNTYRWTDGLSGENAIGSGLFFFTVTDPVSDALSFEIAQPTGTLAVDSGSGNSSRVHLMRVG